MDRGEALFEKYLSKSNNPNNKVISGSDVWRLYDTYGFPSDLTRLMAQEKGYEIDEEEFLREQEKAKVRSRGARSKNGDDAVILDVHAIADLEKKLNVKKTDDSFKYGIL